MREKQKKIQNEGGKLKMNKDGAKYQKGITLISLVVTIVVILILAAISINILSGEDGIISQAIKSKEEQEIGKEKELINLAYTGLKSEDINKQITAEDMENEINNINGAGTVEVTGQGSLKIEFLESNRNYLIDVETGKVEQENKELEELVGEAYAAIYDNTQLVFGRTEGEIPTTYTYTNSSGIETVGTLTKGWTEIETLEAESSSDIPWRSYARSIENVETINEISPINTAYWFNNFMYCKSLDLTKLYMSNVTDMTAMFQCAGMQLTTCTIKGLDKWDTGNVKSMRNLFNYSTWTINKDIINWNVSNVTDMYRTFYDTDFKSTTIELDLSNWDVSNVTNMYGMFENIGGDKAESVKFDLSNWNTINVTDMSYMFAEGPIYAKEFEIKGIEFLNTSKVENMAYMFKGTFDNVPTVNLNLSNWDVSNVKNMSFMFQGAFVNATEWSIGDIGKWNVSSVTNMNHMFSEAGKYATTFYIGDLSNWNVSNVTNMRGMFGYTGGNAIIFYIGNLNNWDVSNVTNMQEMFQNAGYNATYTLDLTAWSDKVSKVSYHDNFNYNVESKVIAPKWAD